MKKEPEGFGVGHWRGGEAGWTFEYGPGWTREHAITRARELALTESRRVIVVRAIGSINLEAKFVEYPK